MAISHFTNNDIFMGAKVVIVVFAFDSNLDLLISDTIVGFFKDGG